MPQPQLVWRPITGYDFFISLHTIFNPAKFELRRAWAAGVRSRLPVHTREVLERYTDILTIPFAWLDTLPDPVDGATILAALSELPPADRVHKLVFPRQDENLRAVIDRVVAAGQWDDADIRDIQHFIKHRRGYHLKSREVTKWLESGFPLWSNPHESGERLLEGFSAYFDVFFAEEEQRIMPAFEARIADAQRRADVLPLDELLEELSQGLRFDFEDLNQRQSIEFIPSYWTSPLVIYHDFSPQRWMLIFGARPASESLVPGDVVPDSLYLALKALADPTRLRILRYLSNTPQTPAQLSRQLRLRAPTITHHLQALRMAGLVHMTLKAGNERHYAARDERVQEVFALLDDFLAEPDQESEHEPVETEDEGAFETTP